MKAKHPIPDTIIIAATGLLQPFYPDLSPQSLLDRLNAPASGDLQKPSALLTRREVADLLRVSIRAVDRMLASGELKKVKNGRRVGIPSGPIMAILRGKV